MKNLIFVNGTMGAGKTSVCRELKMLLPPSVFLDGDWCWDAFPFSVTDGTRQMVVNNICFLLNSFLKCSEYQNIIFCWVMHEQTIVDSILSRLSLDGVKFRLFTLTLSEEALRTRLGADVAAGIRQPDVIERSVARLPLYRAMDSTKIDVTYINAHQAAAEIASEYIKAD